MQSFNKIKVTITIIRSVLQALYNPRDLSDAHHLECWTFELALVMHRQHSIATMNLVTRYLLLTLVLLNM